MGDGIEDSPGTVVSVSEQTGLATVELGGDKELPRYSDTVQVHSPDSLRPVVR